MSTELTIKKLLPVLTSEKLTEKNIKLLNTTYVGIDFGTSTTVVSIAILGKEKEPIIVKPIELNQKLVDGTIFSSYKIPSVIAWKNNKLIIGEGAFKLKFKLRQGKNLWHSFKMELGEDVGCKYPNSELGKNNKVTILNPIHASTIFFKYLKIQIERYIKNNNLHSNIEYAISIPASFEANQRRDLIDSLENNQFKINKQSLIDEPNAAFLSYVAKSSIDGKHLHIPEDYFPNVLVFDFGAGTCDISILELGKDNNGVYSKNIAISKFEKIGGNDIDKLIAVDVLLPQLLEGTNLKIEDFRTRELNSLIIPKLLAAAERLKIMLSENISLKLTTIALPELAVSQDYISLGKRIEIETRKGILSIEEPKLTFKEFAKINTIFTKENNSLPTKRIENEVEFVSVFTPIKSALKKANLQIDEIDYVLFIGGSAKNPFIQKAVSNYFSESEILLPQDLQAHVSSGAAIHSLIYNGFGKNVIQPITSEPIMLITKDGYKDIVEPIVEAGTVIPSDIKIIDNLRPQKEGQKVIELPICVGNKNKLLFNIKLFNPNDEGFSLTTPVKLALEINADKMLLIRASAGDKVIMVEPLSPFSNKEMTTEQRIKFKAERDFNLECERNGGEPTLSALQTLHKVYQKIKLEFKAAETLEQIEEMFPGKGNLNNIGLHYSNAGKKEKAISFYEKAMQESPSSTTAFNIAIQFKYKDAKKHKEYLKKAHNIDPTDNTVAYNLGQEYIKEGKEEKGEKLMQGAFDNWKKKFETKNNLQSWEYYWFSSCARALGKKDYAIHIEESKPKEILNKMYNSENLTQVKQNNELQKF
ncbi:Hsp70 family protein [Tenacibaculum finnmarkense]|uniref:Hsp70 family protein n=1 Tax=Tenacibaculum finnmarkense TaxID=2781243 RepID=UPI001EFB45FC|nr:Hsp70 family protein [Tenacibaculum finnmarkense]MCG8803274.1 Hsp70 family protein [Tenacibaculum finnmarkense]MCG8826089.1 Hsp70 family protein [Tenacibaculum finnmarkense]